MAGVDSGVETGVGQKKTGQGSIQVNSRQVCVFKNSSSKLPENLSCLLIAEGQPHPKEHPCGSVGIC